MQSRRHLVAPGRLIGVFPGLAGCPTVVRGTEVPTLHAMATRQYVFPRPDDDLASIAARTLPGAEDAEQQLLSWNLHLAMRAGLGRGVGLLPSDVVFVEPPLAR